MKVGPEPRPFDGTIPGCVPHEGLTLVTGSKVYGTRTDRRALFARAIGVDFEEGEGVDLVHDLEEPFADQWLCQINPWLDPTSDYIRSVNEVQHIDCVSTLEHVQRPWLAAKNLQDVLVQGGTIFVTVPFAWRVHAYPSDYWRMTPHALRVIFDEIDWQHLLYYSQRDGLTEGYPKPTKEFPFMVPRCEVYGWGVKR